VLAHIHVLDPEDKPTDDFKWIDPIGGNAGMNALSRYVEYQLYSTSVPSAQLIAARFANND
jgi:hypothetical protein